jgi:hypothetical protein
MIQTGENKVCFSSMCAARSVVIISIGHQGAFKSPSLSSDLIAGFHFINVPKRAYSSENQRF